MEKDKGKGPPRWAWTVGLPGGVLAVAALTYGLLGAFFESRAAHSEEVGAWRTMHVAESREAHNSQAKAVAAGAAEAAIYRVAIDKKFETVQQTVNEVRLDVSQIVCVTVHKGKPIGPRCTLPNGQVIEDVRVR